jgi:hypothetical protein
LAASAIIGASPAAAEPVSLESARDLVRRGDILPLQEVLSRRHQPALDGEIVEASLERGEGGYLYRIKVLGRDGRYRDHRASAGAAGAGP